MGKTFTVTEQPNTGRMTIVTIAIVIIFFVAINFVPAEYEVYTTVFYVLFFVGLIVVNAVFERKNRRQLQINERQFVILRTGD